MKMVLSYMIVSLGVKDFILYCFCPWAPFILFIKFLLTADGSSSVSESLGRLFSFKLKCERSKSNAIGVWSQRSNAFGESIAGMDSSPLTAVIQFCNCRGKKNEINKWNQIRLEWVNLNYSPWSLSPLYPSPQFLYLSQNKMCQQGLKNSGNDDKW